VLVEVAEKVEKVIQV